MNWLFSVFALMIAPLYVTYIPMTFGLWYYMDGVPLP
jgi:hypothetical protein